MTTAMRAFRGTVVGLLCSLLAVPGTITLSPHGRSVEAVLYSFILVLMMSPFMVAIFGPGAFLLSYLHATQMEKWARRPRTGREIPWVGVLLGMPLGIANLIFTVWIIAFFNGTLDKLTITREALILAIPALAGGAGIGWGVTSDLFPPRPLPRPRPRPLIRRNGPPFFDDRPRGTA